MFELIKFYINARKDEKFLKMAELEGLYIKNDSRMTELAESLLKTLYSYKKMIKFNPFDTISVDLAKFYNEVVRKRGF